MYGCWNDRIRKNCLGVEAHGACAADHSTVTTKDCVVLFPLATGLLQSIPSIEFVRGIPADLELGWYFDPNINNLFVIDDQLQEASNNNQIMNLFTKGSHHRNRV